MKPPLAIVHSILAETRIQGLLVGGLAVQQYGVSRATYDLDLAIAEEHDAVIADALRHAGYEERARTPLFARWRYCEPASMDIDTMFQMRGRSRQCGVRVTMLLSLDWPSAFPLPNTS